MMSRNLYIYLCFLFVAVLRPQVYAVDAFQIADLGTSAEMISIGNIEGFSQTASGIFENPAGIHRVGKSSVAGFTTTIIGEVNYNNVSISTGSPLGKIGVGYMEAVVQDVPETYKNLVGEYAVASRFDYRDAMMKATLQNSLSDTFHLGVSYSYYFKRFWTVSASGHNMDVGLIWEARHGTVSLHARNILPGQKLTYAGGKTPTSNVDGLTEDIPMHWVLSGKTSYWEFDFLGQIKQKLGRQLFSAGLIYHPSFLQNLQLRGGLKQILKPNGVIKPVYSVGLSLYLFELAFDYAYEKSEHIEYDNKNYFSASFNIQ